MGPKRGGSHRDSETREVQRDPRLRETGWRKGVPEGAADLPYPSRNTCLELCAHKF